MVVRIPRLIVPNRFLDFGAGFYTTSNFEQAKSFAEGVVRRQNSGVEVVSVFEFDESLLETMDTLCFSDATDEWLDYVSAQRGGVYSGKSYDLIYGPVANDNVYQTILLYFDGVLTRKQTIENLKVKELYNQLVFASEAALGHLTFVGKWTWEDEANETE